MFALRTILFLLCFAFILSPLLSKAAESLDYTVLIKGVKNKELEKALEYSSDAIALKDKPPATLTLLNLRIRADIRRFRQLLNSRGYYAATVKSSVDGKVKPVTVSFDIVLGRPFVFSTVTINNSSSIKGVTFPSAEELGLKAGKIAEAKEVITAQEKIIRSLNEQGFPFATVKEPSVIVDHKTYTMAVTFDASPDSKAYFGETSIHGLETVNYDFIARKIPWKKGELYTPVLIEQYEKSLNETGLFAIATVEKSEKIQQNGEIPITVTMKERLQRTVKAGVNYQTDEGPGIKLLWQHRNFFHEGEEVAISGSASAVKRSINNTFTRNDFLRKYQSLKLFFELDNEDTDAYYSNNASIGSAVERKLTQKITAGLGVNYKISHIKDSTDDDGDFSLVSVPLYAKYDSRDNILDPSKGNSGSIQFAPFMNMIAGHSSFTKEYMSSSHYLSFATIPSVVLAGRATIGLIQSVSTSNVPPNERFYAGGSGSVRGYAFQSLGPLHDDGTPAGGRSLAEFSGEIRFRASPKIGLVTFLDGGNSFDAIVPNLTEGIRLGMGVGIRYYTAIAPVRFDIGVPLSARDNSDQPVQFYISLGQAF